MHRSAITRSTSCCCTRALRCSCSSCSRTLTVPGAWLAAAVFALHPVHVESVAWITERRTSLSGFFYLAAALCYLRFSELPTPRRGWLAAGFTAFIAALLPGKTVAASLPSRCSSSCGGSVSDWNRRELAPLLPLFAAGAVMGSRRSGSRSTTSAPKATPGRSLSSSAVCLAGRALWFYVAQARLADEP